MAEPKKWTRKPRRVVREPDGVLGEGPDLAGVERVVAALAPLAPFVPIVLAMLDRRHPPATRDPAGHRLAKRCVRPSCTLGSVSVPEAWVYCPLCTERLVGVQ
jgi:hypothetical protein